MVKSNHFPKVRVLCKDEDNDYLTLSRFLKIYFRRQNGMNE